MSEERMVELVQDALAARGIEDDLVAAGQFNPRGQTGGLFAGGLIGGDAGSALGGATTVLGASADPAVVLPLIERWRVDLLKLLPTGLDDFVEAEEHEHHDLSSLRAVAVAGDKVPMEVHHRFSDLSGFEATEYIGMTECSYYPSNHRSGRSGSVRLGGRRRATRSE
jgi:acyl-coenzyme A synthetase/AMP-(fatty) acid ligase